MSPRKRTAPPLSWESLEHAAECLKTIAHPVRLRMLETLLTTRATVGELAEICEIASHQASEHLRLLRDRGLLESEREGRRTYHHVTEPAVASILECVERRFGG